MSVESKVRAVTTLRLKEMKDRGEKIAMLTSYDYSMAKIVDAVGVDVILVGDSAANVMAGYETTVPITLDAMIYHARSVVRAVERALVVVDLPFGTYQGNSKMALDSAIRIMKETEADAVKLEGGEEILESVERIGAGGGTDGQVLVIHDMLGINKGFSPRFLRRYADLHTVMTDAVGRYVADVKSQDFPNEQEQY